MKQNQNKITDLILHGHFYQPPRENPLVDIIPKQPSAKPYPDWNERIYDDCYRANAFSRYLDGYGHIRDIVNNYEFISFNFGPTLMQWLKRYHVETYRKILEADRLSEQRLGHGNAIAQAYNHTILPLDSEQNARTQILWGIADFEHRFNRRPEGIWLPETAISPMVIDLLAEAGISFVVLSPWQCASVEQKDGSYRSVSGTEVPYDTPYLISGTKGGTIAAFFYHPELASSISFGHMLRDADAMYKTLDEIREYNQPTLLHTATDGEIYGHHEPFGDMALAALVRKVNDNQDFRLTNYATYLEEHPAVLKAELHAGEDNRGTSWSCAHGVSRWYKDCGCHTGGEDGWNQQWRGPLREAFTELGNQVDELFSEHIHRLFNQKVDPYELLLDYNTVLSKVEDIGNFIDRWEARADVQVEDKRAVAELLEGQRYKHYMFTSCGWFFSDLSGIEPRQNIHYAVRTIDLYQRFSDTDLLKSILPLLKQARSNRRHEGSGSALAKSYVSEVGGEAEAAAFFLMNQNFARVEDHKDSYGMFRLEAYRIEDEQTYSCEVLDTSTMKRSSITMEVETSGENGYEVRMVVRDMATEAFGTHVFSTKHIPPRMLDEVYAWIDHSLSRVTDEELELIATDIRHYSLLAKNGRSAPSETLYVENMGTCLRALRSLFTTPNTLPWEQKRESISYLLEFIKQKGRQHEHDIVKQIFSSEVSRVAILIHEQGFNYERSSYLLEVLNVAREQGIQPIITQAQEALHPYIKGEQRDLFNTPLTKSVLESLRIALNFSVD